MDAAWPRQMMNALDARVIDAVRRNLVAVVMPFLMPHLTVLSVNLRFIVYKQYCRRSKYHNNYIIIQRH